MNFDIDDIHNRVVKVLVRMLQPVGFVTQALEMLEIAHQPGVLSRGWQKEGPGLIQSLIRAS